MNIEFDLLTKVYDLEEEVSVPRELRYVDRVFEGGSAFTFFLGHLPKDGERGLRWLVCLRDCDTELLTQLVESDSRRFGSWPEGERLMVLEMRKRWENGKFWKEYTLTQPDDSIIELVNELVSIRLLPSGGNVTILRRHGE